MFVSLVAKECRQTFKSLIYLIFVVCLTLFFFTQLGNADISGKPKKGQEYYGSKLSTDPQDVMKATLTTLAQEFTQDRFVTYPIGFAKTVRTTDEEKQQIQDILLSSVDLTLAELEEQLASYYENKQTIYQPMEVKPKPGLDYKIFLSDMQTLDDILGGGSSYSNDSLEKGVSAPNTYEDAIAEYNDLIEKDRLTGGYARLFCDYISIILGVAPVFLAVTRGLRDKRSQMAGLIHAKRVSSIQIIVSRYASMLLMIMIPVLILSCFTLAECSFYASAEGLSIDYLAFVKYSFIWLLPECMVVTAVGMFLTELTDTAVAVLTQIIWWYLSIFSGMPGMSGGDYGFNLIMRHNTPGNYTGFINDISQLAANRILYAIISIVLVIVTIWVYEQKRKGRLNIHGKIFGNWKRKSKA